MICPQYSVFSLRQVKKVYSNPAMRRSTAACAVVALLAAVAHGQDNAASTSSESAASTSSASAGNTSSASEGNTSSASAGNTSSARGKGFPTPSADEVLVLELMEDVSYDQFHGDSKLCRDMIYSYQGKLEKDADSNGTICAWFYVKSRSRYEILLSLSLKRKSETDSTFLEVASKFLAPSDKK